MGLQSINNQCVHNVSAFLLFQNYICILHAAASGVATLGHTGARALATRGRAPPVQPRLIVALLIANRSLNSLEIERRSIAMHIDRITCLIRESAVSNSCTLRYGMTSEPTWEGVFFFWTHFRLSLWTAIHIRMRSATPSVYLDPCEGRGEHDRAKEDCS